MSENSPPVMEIEFMDGTRYTVMFGNGRDDARDWRPKPEGLMIRRNPAGSERTVYPWVNVRSYTILTDKTNSPVSPNPGYLNTDEFEPGYMLSEHDAAHMDAVRQDNLRMQEFTARMQGQEAARRAAQDTAPVTTSTYHIQADTPKTPAAEWEEVHPARAFRKLLTNSIARRLPASWVSNSDNRARLREAITAATEGWFISHHRIPGENSDCELERLMARLPWQIAEPRPQEPPL